MFPFGNPFSSAASGLGLGGGPAVATSGGPFNVQGSFQGVREGHVDQNTAIILSAAIIGGVIIYGLVK